jgi:hypothetical protein
MISKTVKNQEEFDSICNRREMFDSNKKVVIYLESDIELNDIDSYSNVSFINNSDDVYNVNGNNLSGDNIRFEGVHLKIENINECNNLSIVKCFFDKFSISNVNILNMSRCTGFNIDVEYSKFLKFNNVTVDSNTLDISLFGSEDGFSIRKSNDIIGKSIRIDDKSEIFSTGFDVYKTNDISIQGLSINNTKHGYRILNSEGEIEESVINDTDRAMIFENSEHIIRNCSFNNNEECINKDVAEETSNLEIVGTPAIMAEYLVNSED